MFDIDKLQSKLKSADFYRIFSEATETEQFVVQDGKVEHIDSSSHIGASVFYVKNRFAYFYSTNSQEKIDNFEMAATSKLPQNINYELTESGIKDSKSIGTENNLDLETISKEFARATKVSGKIVTNTGRYIYSKNNRIVICPNTEITQTRILGRGTFNAVAKKEDKIRTDFIRLGITSALNKRIYALLDDNENMRNNLQEKLSYKEGLKGKYDIIINPDLSDLLAHEAIGHATESDAVYTGFSVLSSRLGETLGPEFMTLYDDPVPRDNLFGSFYYDDEGFPAQNKILIKNGVLNDYILSSKYSKLLQMKNNGGSRCMSYSYLPVPRMSNTSFKAGEQKIKDIIRDTKKGVLLSGGRGGQVDPNSGVFQFGVKEGHLIKNGELTENFVNLTFSGNILESLSKVVCISKDIEMNQPGFCGKYGQQVPVGGFGPYMKLKNIGVGQ